MRSALILLFAALLFNFRGYAQQDLPSLQRAFKDPPVTARPKALWPWLNGNASLSQITYEMEESARMGMGGFDIWDLGVSVDPNNVIPAGPAFLSDESVQAIAHAIREADRLNLELGLTISSSWNAGGSWVKPEHGAMGLFRSDTIVIGPATFSAALPFPEIPEMYGDRKTIQYKDATTGLPSFFREVAVIAHPLNADSLVATSAINILPVKNPQEKFRWKVPAGKWRISRYVCAPTGQPLAIPSSNSNGLMLDHFSAAAQKANLDYIFSKLLPVTGDLKNSSLKYLYADSYEVNSGVWTPLLPEAFSKRNGYNLATFLPVLDGFIVESTDITKRFLFDFRKTLSDLIIENHYALGKKICNDHGVGFYAEAGGPGQPIHNVPFEDLKALGSLTVPRGEFWRGHPRLELLQIVKGIASASHIYNQKFVEAESFTSVWLWQEGPDALKPLADRAMCEGLNRFVYHTFPHTPPESGFPGWVYNFGTLINTTNGWWPKSKGFHEYLARCSYLLQQGNFVGDVAFYYGDEAPNFVAPKHIPTSLGFGYDYDVINTEVLLEKFQVKNGKIYLPHGQYYEVLVLPEQQQINLLVLEKLEKLVAEGATIIGPKPQRSVGLKDYADASKKVKALAEKMWGTLDSVSSTEIKYGQGKIVWGKSIRDVLMERGVHPDVSVSQVEKPGIDFIHRRTENAEIYFVRNKEDEIFSSPVTFRIRDKKPSLWDAETGKVIPVPLYQNSDKGISIPLTLRRNESCFVVFTEDTGDKMQWQDVLVNNAPIHSRAKLPAEITYTDAGVVTANAGVRWNWNSDGKVNTVTVPTINPMTLTGPWELRFDQARNTIARQTFTKLKSLSASEVPEIKHFSGAVEYHHRFMLTKDQIKNDLRLILDLGEVKEIAEVFVNGKHVGLSWHFPFTVDITEAVKEGENNLVVEVVNTPNNALVGDAKLPKEYQQMTSNINRLPNAWMTPFAEAPLIEAGLLGPVQIRLLQVLK